MLIKSQFQKKISTRGDHRHLTIYRLLFGFFLQYTDSVRFVLLDSAALLWRESYGWGGQIVFLNFTTIIWMAALSTIHDVTGRRLVSSIYSWDIYGGDGPTKARHVNKGKGLLWACPPDRSSFRHKAKNSPPTRVKRYLSYPCIKSN
jgi:hypothetical protein